MNSFLRLASLFLSSILIVSGVAAEETHGILTVVKGDVNVISGKDNSTNKAKVGMKVYPKDTISAGVDSRAKVTMVDKNILNISPESKVVIESYEFKPEQDKKKVILNVIYGKVRSSVSQKYDGEKNTFQVKTPSAVAGVRGTDFMVQFNSVTNAAKIVTFTGQVEVGAKMDSLGKIVAPVLVNPGQFTVASQSAPPTPPAVMSATELATVKAEVTADAKNSGGDGAKESGSGERRPANENKQNENRDKQEPGEKGPGGPGGPDRRGPDAKDMLRPDSNDLVNDTTGAPPAFADNGRSPNHMMPNIPLDPVCPTCGFNFNPPRIPDDILRGGDTKLIINVQTQ